MTKLNVHRGWMVTTAGTVINLALGILYTWSIFKDAIVESIKKGGPGAFNWKLSALNDPYAICCLIFSFAMIGAGRYQDKVGPRKTAIIGGLLVGFGFILISQTTSYTAWVLGFGVIVGTGLAFGYSAATPAALKWFPPSQTGKVAGIVVSGFGLASVYIAPLATYLVNHFGLQKAMLFFGIGFLLVVSLAAIFLINPPPGYKPSDLVPADGGSNKPTPGHDRDVTPREMIISRDFFPLWVLYFIGAGAGLMVIGSLAGMAKASLGENAFYAVAILAVGNAGGRIAAGILSDKIGRKTTLTGMFIFQALLMFTATLAGSASVGTLVLIATCIGFNYGANLALFPSFTKDLWGMKHFGVNYGILFTAWGMGGFVMSRTSQALMVSSGSYNSSFMVSGFLLILGVFVSVIMPAENK